LNVRPSDTNRIPLVPKMADCRKPPALLARDTNERTCDKLLRGDQDNTWKHCSIGSQADSPSDEVDCAPTVRSFCPYVERRMYRRITPLEMPSGAIEIAHVDPAHREHGPGHGRALGVCDWIIDSQIVG